MPAREIRLFSFEFPTMRLAAKAEGYRKDLNHFAFPFLLNASRDIPVPTTYHQCLFYGGVILIKSSAHYHPGLYDIV
jgi:hypothetical protein